MWDSSARSVRSRSCSAAGSRTALFRGRLRRVRHRGLRLAGLALLATAFVRLPLRPAVFEYHVRSATRIWNWYLYAYALVTICLMAGGRLLAPPRHLVADISAPAILYSL